MTDSPSRKSEDSGSAVYSQSEVRELLQGLTEGRKTKLELIAQAFSWLSVTARQELVNETVSRVLSGDRKWPRDVPAEKFFYQVMRSIRSEIWRGARHNEAPFDPEKAEHHVSDDRTPERETDAKYLLQRILALFNDDPVAQKMVVGMMHKYKGKELQDFCQITDAVTFATKQTKVRRRLAKMWQEINK